jgi:hypothetical protein
VSNERKDIPQKHGRAAHYYRKVALERYSDRPTEGLGQHRLPRLNPDRRRKTDREVPAALWAVVLLTIAVFFFICVISVIALGRVIF